jgi:peptidoglycan/xylan/chitin deacetylase (PgdA/CDA1 family)
MYHSISDDPEPGVRPYYRVCTSPRRFAEHMALLKSRGYRGVTLSEGLAWLRSPLDVERSVLDVGCSPVPPTSALRPPPSDLCSLSSALRPRTPNSDLPAPTSDLRPLTSERPAALTFDDGFRDFHTAAFPILQQHGFNATMYLPTAFIGETRRVFCPRGSSFLRPLTSDLSSNRDCLTWSEVRELHGDGIEFGSHTVTHPKLVELSWPEIESEMVKSKSEIEQRLGATVAAFAYPYAFPQTDDGYVRSFRQLLADAGYSCCVTTEVGRVKTGDDSYRLKRLPVNALDDTTLLQAKLEGRYDWLAGPQAWIKKLKQVPRLRRAKRDSDPPRGSDAQLKAAS